MLDRVILNRLARLTESLTGLSNNRFGFRKGNLSIILGLWRVIQQGRVTGRAIHSRGWGLDALPEIGASAPIRRSSS